MNPRKLIRKIVQKNRQRQKTALIPSLKGLDLDLSGLIKKIPGQVNSKTWIAAIVSSVAIRFILQGVGLVSGFNIRPVLPKNKKPVITYTDKGEPVIHPATAKVKFKKVFDLRIWASMIAYAAGVDVKYILQFLMLNEKVIALAMKKWMGAKVPKGKTFSELFGTSDGGFTLNVEEEDPLEMNEEAFAEMLSGGTTKGQKKVEVKEAPKGSEGYLEGVMLDAIGQYGMLSKSKEKSSYELNFDLQHWGDVKVKVSGHNLIIEYEATYGIYADNSNKQYPVTSDNSLDFLVN